jgi:hypothetical protein
MTCDPDADGALVTARVAENAVDWATTRAACVDHARAIKALADGEAAAVFPRLVAWPRSFAIDATPVT